MTDKEYMDQGEQYLIHTDECGQYQRCGRLGYEEIL